MALVLTTAWADANLKPGAYPAYRALMAGAGLTVTREQLQTIADAGGNLIWFAEHVLNAQRLTQFKVQLRADMIQLYTLIRAHRHNHAKHQAAYVIRMADLRTRMVGNLMDKIEKQYGA